MAPRTDRKLAAIMALDVVGYSRLVGADEAGTLARVKAHRVEFVEPLVTDYHGRVVKLTGDGALVEFASAVDAVECAVAIQGGMSEREAAEPEGRRIRFRIGINIGDIVLEDGDIFGDGVNVAARLEGLAEPGGICIARNVYNQVKNKLAFGFEPMGKHQVKNITEPVEVYRVLADPGPIAKMVGLRRAGTPRLRWVALAAAVALAVIVAGGASWWYAGLPGFRDVADAASDGGAEANAALPLPDKPSIAVLPFDNLSGEERYERLANGLTEDVITDLSRFHTLFVIARNSTEVYKDKAVDVREVARDLGVQYVLEGSLQAEGDRLRITAQLLDGTTGNHVWAERYDRRFEDLFVVQDEVTKKIAGTLAPSMGGVLTRAGREIARRKPPKNLQAYESYLLGIEHKHRFTQEDNQKALELLTKATELDPGFARAYVGLAAYHDVAIGSGWVTSRQDALDNMSKALRKALALDPADGQAHLFLGIYYVYVGDFEHAIAAFESALSLNPNDADVLVVASALLPQVGSPEKAAEAAERAVRINPNYPEWYKLNLMLAYFYGGQYDRALAATSSNLNPSVWDFVYRPLIYAYLDQEADATRAAAKLLEIDPEYSAERFLNDAGMFARDVELNRLLDGHRKAGLPLCATEEQMAKYPDMKRLEQCEQQRASG